MNHVNVAKDEFEERLESESPPTITNLAEQGMSKGVPLYEQLGMTKKSFQAFLCARKGVYRAVKKAVDK